MLAHDLHWPLLDVLEAHGAEQSRMPRVMGRRGELLNPEPETVGCGSM